MNGDMNEESEGGKESGTCDDEREEFKERKKKKKAENKVWVLIFCFCLCLFVSVDLEIYIGGVVGHSNLENF